MKLIANKLHRDRDEILNFCSVHSRIIVYGAGFVGALILRYLEEEGINVSAVIVSDDAVIASKNELYQYQHVGEFVFEKNDGIIIATGIEFQAEIKKELLKHQILERQIYCQLIYKQYIEGFEKIYSAIQRESGNVEGYFAEYKTLDEYGKINHTDKSSEDHNFLMKYEFFVKKWRNRPVKLLELGIYRGGSLKTWSQYFEQGMIYGVDIDESCKQYEGKNIKVFIQDLGDEEKIKSLGRIQPDIIIDDASHFWSHQIKALYQLMPELACGGVYILEDLNTSFATQRANGYDDAVVSAYEFCQAVAHAVTSGAFLNITNVNPWLVQLKEEILEVASMIEMISFIHNSCIIVKK